MISGIEHQGSEPPPSAYGAAGLEDPPPVAADWCERIDVAIIGGGLTGLSAAYHLAATAGRIAVFEAHGFGHGASGRAFGQVVPYLKHRNSRLLETYGNERGQKIVADIAAGPDLVFGIIVREHIVCAQMQTGLLFGARTAGGQRSLEATAAEWQALGAPIEMLAGTAASTLCGSALYPAVLLDRRGGHLDPLAYTRGLGRAATSRGVRLYANTPIERLSRAGRHWQLTTSSRTAIADTVILATNAYPANLSDGLAASFVAVQVHGAITAAIPNDAMVKILPGNQPLTDTRRLYSGVRKLGNRLHLTVDGPIFSPGGTPDLGMAKARLAELYPWLPPPVFAETWRGLIAVTSDQLPRVHELAPGLWTGFGYSGRGLAAATIVGRDLARRVLGRPEEDLTFPVSPLRPLRSHRLARLAVAATISAYRWLDRREAPAPLSRTSLHGRTINR